MLKVNENIKIAMYLFHRLKQAYFCQMSLKNAAVNSILEKLNIKSLNEMQFKANAAIEKQNNILLLSATGSGKTLAFLLPLLKLID